MTSLTATPAWKALEAHASSVAGLHMRDLFAADPGRFGAFSISLPGMLLDYAKNRVTKTYPIGLQRSDDGTNMLPTASPPATCSTCRAATVPIPTPVPSNRMMPSNK